MHTGQYLLCPMEKCRKRKFAPGINYEKLLLLCHKANLGFEDGAEGGGTKDFDTESKPYRDKNDYLLTSERTNRQEDKEICFYFHRQTAPKPNHNC